MGKPAARTATAVMLLSVAAMPGCGGGGSGDDGGGSLSFRAHWEQSDAGAGPSRGERAFAAAIPQAVQTVRIAFSSSNAQDPLDCCIAIRRGTPTFAARSVVLSDLPVGNATFTVGGFPTDFAPADGVARTCTTVPAGAAEACDGARAATPSYHSDPQPIGVIGGQRTAAGDVAVPALPFLSEIDPAPGSVVGSPSVPLKVVVTETTNAIVQASIAVSVSAGTPPAAYAFNQTESTPCDERGAAAATPCGDGPDLDAHGFIVAGVTDPLPAGLATVMVTASNDAATPRGLAFSFDFVVSPGATTTTTTSTTQPAATTTTTTLPPQTTTTTTTTTTSTTTTSTTTTTLPGQAQTRCLVFFRIDSTAVLGGLTFDVGYVPAPGEFPGNGNQVACSVSVGVDAFGAFDDDDVARSLNASVQSPTQINAPTRVAVCGFEGPMPPMPQDFFINVTESHAPDFSPLPVPVIIDEILCDAPTPSTTMLVPPALVGSWTGTFTDDPPGTKNGTMDLDVMPGGHYSGMLTLPFGECTNDPQRQCTADTDCIPPGQCANDPAVFGGQIELSGDFTAVVEDPANPGIGIVMFGMLRGDGTGNGLYQGLPPEPTTGSFALVKMP